MIRFSMASALLAFVFIGSPTSHVGAQAANQATKECDYLEHSQPLGDSGEASIVYASSSDMLSASIGDLKRLIASQMDPNAVEEGSHWSLLAMAGANGRFEVVKYLVESGACVDIRDMDGITPLIQTSCTTLIRTESGKAQNPGFRKTIEFLLHNGADPNARSSNSTTALICAASENHVDIMEPLLEGGAELNATSSYGWTALMTAANTGHVRAVTYLLNNGADLEQRDNDGLTALILATLEGHKKILNSLIAAGADVNAQGRLSHSPLMVVSMQGNEEFARILLRNKADMSLENYKGQTAMMLAKERGQPSIMAILREAGAQK